jgi:hypothetical protein
MVYYRTVLAGLIALAVALAPLARRLLLGMRWPCRRWKAATASPLQ